MRPFWRLLGSMRSLEMRMAGRTVFHALMIGAAMGLVACGFFALLQVAEHLLLEGLAGYQALRPAGEKGFDWGLRAPHIRPFVLWWLPAAGGLVAGLLAYRIAHETAGGGGDAYIDGFHRRGGLVRKRVAWVKMVATAFTLGSGGSAGREGPTMQVGAAVASLVSRGFDVSPRERRILMVAGTAAGLSAIFGTPLGAALFATEVLYRDDFESDALIPAILASVTAHSIFVSVYPSHGELFAHAPRYPFHPIELPLFALLAVAISLGARLFVFMLHRARLTFRAMPIPVWLRPAIGGLALGSVAASWIVFVNPLLGLQGRGAGILGTGYGAAQAAITGSPWLAGGWFAVVLLVVLALFKILATSLTLGSGGSGGDFGPSLAIGALIGGAFGRAAQLLLSPSIDPGAFALVGMGTFYGGIAHVPVSSLVMVCEMAGNYDLLVPLMLAEGIAFLLLRRVTLYPSQPASRFQSPMHAGEESLDLLKRIRVRDVFRRGTIATLKPTTRVPEIMQVVSEAADWQDTFPVWDENKGLVGLIAGDLLRSLRQQEDLGALVVAADVMAAPASVHPDEDLHAALEKLLACGLRELPVLDDQRTVLGLLDEAEVTRAYHDTITRMLEGEPRSSSFSASPPSIR